MKLAAKYNNLPIKDIEPCVENYFDIKDNKEMDNNKGNLWDLFKTPIIRMYTLIICFDWMVCGLCFFGVSQFIGQLGGDIFINVAVSAVIQIPSTLFACWSTKSWGRKKTLLLSFILGSISLFLLGKSWTIIFFISEHRVLTQVFINSNTYIMIKGLFHQS